MSISDNKQIVLMLLKSLQTSFNQYNKFNPTQILLRKTNNKHLKHKGTNINTHPTKIINLHLKKLDFTLEHKSTKIILVRVPIPLQFLILSLLPSRNNLLKLREHLYKKIKWHQTICPSNNNKSLRHNHNLNLLLLSAILYGVSEVNKFSLLALGLTGRRLLCNNVEIKSSYWNINYLDRDSINISL